MLAFCTSRLCIIKGTEETWHVNKEDTTDGLLLVINASQDFKNVVLQKEQACRAKGITFQPVPIVVKNVKSCTAHVCINSEFYDVESPVQALDLCYKSYFVLNAKFPQQSKQSWLFIQNFLYGMKSKDRCNTARNLAAKLEMD